MNYYDKIYNENGELIISHEDLVNLCYDALVNFGGDPCLCDTDELCEDLARSIEKNGLYKCDKNDEDIKAWLDLEGQEPLALYRIPSDPSDYNCENGHVCFRDDWQF